MRKENSSGASLHYVFASSAFECSKGLFNLGVTWILFSFSTEARPSWCLGGKFYFKPFIYVPIKIVYFYGIHKSSLPLFCIQDSKSGLVYFKQTQVSCFITIIFGAGMFYDILLLKQNFFSQYIYHLRHASKFALFQGVCMDDECNGLAAHSWWSVVIDKMYTHIYKLQDELC